MKAKTIDKILRKKLNDLISSIDDKDIQYKIDRYAIITGGCITSMFLQEKVNDYDIYFENIKTAKDVAEYYIKEFKQRNKKGHKITLEIEDNRIFIKVKSAGIAVDKESEDTDIEIRKELDKSGEESDVIPDKKKHEYKKYTPIFISSNAITLSNNIQLITRFYGNPEEIHSNYDFIHTTNYWTKRDGLKLNADALAATLSKELIYVGSKYPLASIIRSRKFIQRHWTINAGQYVKMALQLNEMDLTDLDTLKDQLTGVDLSYFQEMLESIPEGKEITTGYLIDLINKFF